MRKKERVETILRTLETLYPQVIVPLSHTSPFTLLIAVLLSAQSTDKKVNEITPQLFDAADTPEKMMLLPVATVKTIIAPIGLSNKKSQAIVDLSKILIEKHNGVVPKTLEELTSLPLVGRKTAQVVLIQAFNIPAFPVDTHIHRLAKRWRLSKGKNVEETEKDLRAAFPKRLWIKLHLQIIFFGREYCPARGHNELLCPLCSKFLRK